MFDTFDENDTYLKVLSLMHFRGFQDITISFENRQVIVILGQNAVGKSSVLDALGYCLAYFSDRLFSLKPEIDDPESKLTQEDINIESEQATCELEFKWINRDIRIFTSIELGNDKPSFSIEPSEFIKDLRRFVSSDESLSIPIISYYRSHRSKIEEDHSSYPGTYDQRVYTIHRAFREGFSNFTGFESWYAAVHEEALAKGELDKLYPINTSLLSFLNEFHDGTYNGIRIVPSRIKSPYKYYNFRIEVRKRDNWILLRNLSSGEKSIIYLVCDIARRLSVGNSFSDTSLYGTGIVLIDEVELHLHPAWQRKILPSLTTVFPNVQFVVSTHSPLVLSTLKDKSIYVLDGSSYFTISMDPKGRDTNSILEEILDVPSRPPELEGKINHLLKKLALEVRRSPEIDSLFTEILREVSADDPLLIRLQNKIRLLR